MKTYACEMNQRAYLGGGDRKSKEKREEEKKRLCNLLYLDGIPDSSTMPTDYGPVTWCCCVASNTGDTLI